jgi:hypothetical protein
VTARNPKAYQDGQAVRAAVKAIMAAHSPLLLPLTAKVINDETLAASAARREHHPLAHAADSARSQAGIDAAAMYPVIRALHHHCQRRVGLGRSYFEDQLPAHRGQNGRCTVCTHIERVRIELMLAGGAGHRAIGRKYGLTHYAVGRHWSGHVTEERKAALVLGPVQRQALAARVAEESESVLDHHKATRCGLYARYDAAIEHLPQRPKGG